MKQTNEWMCLLMIVVTFLGCSNDPGKEVTPEKPEVTLTASPTSFSFEAAGGTADLSISSNAVWKINYNTSEWCKPSIQTTSGNATVTLTAEENTIEQERSMSMTLTAKGADDISLQITQAAAVIIPPDPEPADSIAPDNTGMASDAKVIASKMYLGWNLGNTLEAIGGETAWGNPKASNDLIVAVKNAGFNAIRIPCAWDNYIENQTTYKIKESWLARVKEVVDYCVDNDMYAILNVHWDGGWLENNVTPEKQNEVNKKQAAIWKQIAITFRDYDEQLLFAGANEPAAETQTAADVLAVYMQTFVDVVRATGGRNTYRNLIVQAPVTDIDKADELMSMPTDETENRLLAEVHYYTPWQFCGLTEDASWGKVFYFWGENYHLDGATGRFPDWDCEEDFVKAQFQKMKTKFVDEGIPMILGEYGAIRRTIPGNDEWQEKHNESRAYFNEYVTEQAKKYGLVPFYWDEGSLKNDGFGIFDRSTNTVGDQQILDGLIKGAEAEDYPY
ncbi:cellulase family glycosylhydrolase [Sunxiuqinia indica]|uniref:cellulase family glycosylhydrolase n=1 Tax=Sunxiuqinia indica TaxID=2692584 RepID=UPI0019161D56|nr:cellulase family glycosylhydrolase [Sunxiuqinia indica]